MNIALLMYLSVFTWEPVIEFGLTLQYFCNINQSDLISDSGRMRLPHDRPSTRSVYSDISKGRNSAHRDYVYG